MYEKNNEYQEISDNYDSDEFETDTDDASSITTTRTGTTSTISYGSQSYVKWEKFTRPPQNYTFTDDKLRQIELENSILMEKILRNSTRKNQYKEGASYKPKPSRFLMNQQKEQMRIDYENQILWKKIQRAKPSIRRN